MTRIPHAPKETLILRIMGVKIRYTRVEILAPPIKKRVIWSSVFNMSLCVNAYKQHILQNSLYVYLLSILVYCIFFIALCIRKIFMVCLLLMAWVDTKLPVNSKVIYGFETSLKSALEHSHKKDTSP